MVTNIFNFNIIVIEDTVGNPLSDSQNKQLLKEVERLKDQVCNHSNYYLDVTIASVTSVNKTLIYFCCHSYNARSAVIVRRTAC